MYCRYDSYDFNGRSTQVRSALRKGELENSLKDGKAGHNRLQNASQHYV